MTKSVHLRRAWLLAVLTLAAQLFCLHGAWAQPGPSWRLHNASNQTVKFETLDPARGTWRSQQIFPNQTTSYTMTPGVNAEKIRIATTGRGFVEYDVLPGGAYRVVWDQAKGVWDVRTSSTVGSAAPVNAPPVRAAYELHNATQQALTFETLDPARGHWRSHTIQPRDTRRMAWHSGSEIGKIRISTTGRGYVEYDVRAGWRYSVVWDRQKGMWDVRTIQRA